MKQKGITLIALVVTIVVLIILASVSITSISGEEGIIINASKAKFMTEVQNIKEQIELEKVKNESKEIRFGTLKNIIGQDDKYNKILSVEDGKLVYDVEEVSERQTEWLENMGIRQKQNLIPIYTANQFQKIASEEDIRIEETGGIIYNFAKDGKYFIQNDINLNGNEESQWNTIDLFEGILDGQNYKVIGLYISDEAGENKGIFSENKGTIKNLQINDANILVESYSGILTSSNTGEISNIKINGKIESLSTSVSQIGGICGTNNGKIFNSYNYATVIGLGNMSGGICGQNGTEGTIERCINEGIITKGYNLGGIAGENYGIINECKNNGNIKTVGDYGHPYGGICGKNYSNIQNCYNFKVVGSEEVLSRYIAGIAGYNDTNGIMMNCYSIGTIYGQVNYKSGIVSANNGKISNCWYIKKGDYELQYSASTGIAENSGEKTEEEMKQIEFIQLLNQGEQIWEQSQNKNEGYPYFKWE